MKREKKVWTKLKCPFDLEDFYESQKNELSRFKDLGRPYNSVNFSVKFKDLDIPIYSQYLRLLLISENDTILNKTPLITIKDIVKYFLKGYQKGYHDFETNHKLNTNNLYSNSEAYLKKIRRLYFGDTSNNVKGCKYYIEFNPIGITLERMEEIGFAHGHLFHIEELLRNEKELFKSILEAPGKSQQEKAIQNKYPTIFKDDQSCEIFEKLHELYSSETGFLAANYSFIFYAMQKDGFIICKNADFIGFLSESFKIEIDRIDSRQKKSYKKRPIYDALKNAIITHK